MKRLKTIMRNKTSLLFALMYTYPGASPTGAIKADRFVTYSHPNPNTCLPVNNCQFGQKTYHFFNPDTEDQAKAHTDESINAQLKVRVERLMESMKTTLPYINKQFAEFIDSDPRNEKGGDIYIYLSNISTTSQAQMIGLASFERIYNTNVFLKEAIPQVIQGMSTAPINIENILTIYSSASLELNHNHSSRICRQT